jgi:hypothetical protein
MKLLFLVVIATLCTVLCNAQDTIAPSKNFPTVTNAKTLKNYALEKERLGIVSELGKRRPRKSCCELNPFALTPCTQSLLQSFKNLVTGAGVSICNTSVNYPSVSFAMPHNCYSLMDTSTSIVTYTSFYIPNTDEFRVIWGSLKAQFDYYGVCAPSPIIYPFPGITENHVFGAKLIRQADYKAFATTPKDYVTMVGVAGIKIGDIETIISVYLEDANGYIRATEQANYDNVYSSKGIVVKVKMKTGTIETCYLINNYDTAGTLNWKEGNPSCK